MIAIQDERQLRTERRMSIYAPSKVRLTYGIHSICAEIAGLTVAEAQLAYKEILSVSDDAEAYVNGQRVEKSRTLHHGDRLELMKVAGSKGSRDELRRIAVALERIADRLEDKQRQPRLQQSENLLNIEEAADYLRMSSKKLRQIVRRSRRRSEGFGVVGPTIQFQQDGAGASIRFKQEWLDDYLDESTVSPTDGQPPRHPRRPKKIQRGDVELAEGKHINFDYLD